MEIGNWSATAGLNESYQRIRALGLESNIAELDAFGFTVIEGAASPDLVERLVRAVSGEVERKDNVRPEVVDGRTAHEGMKYRNHLLHKDPAFVEALLLEKPLALGKYMVGDSCIFSTMGSHFRGPGGNELPLHADMGAWLPAPFPRQPLFVNYTLALTNYTREEGCVAVVPGSHRYARAPGLGENTAVDGNPLAVPVEVAAGSAIVWHGNLWHGGYVRTVPGYRINLAMVFLRPGLMPQEDYRGLISDEMIEAHGETFARLMGRDVPWLFSEEEGVDYTKTFKQLIANMSWHG